MLADLIVKNDAAGDVMGSAIRVWQSAVEARDKAAGADPEPCSGSEVLEKRYRALEASVILTARLVDLAQAAAILAAPSEFSAEQILWAQGVQS
ncbi:MAG: hypothetical protein LAQ69_15220 [Acidobacteriia bacterium]|nr:hypothetical protein [Terriglobia bacterium]